MPRKFKDPRRQALADARIAANQKRTERKRAVLAGQKAGIVSTAEQRRAHHAESVVAAEKARDVYIRELEAGLTQTEIAKKYGVSRQAVHGATQGYRRRIAQQRELDRARRPAEVAGYKCSVCGGDHNARRHETDIPVTGEE